MINFS
ncbi:hypothetical protein MAR_021072 [Mya arenaria]